MTYRPSGSGATLSSYVVIQYCICTGHDNKTFTYLLTYLLKESSLIATNEKKSWVACVEFILKHIGVSSKLAYHQHFSSIVKNNYKSI